MVKKLIFYVKFLIKLSAFLFLFYNISPSYALADCKSVYKCSSYGTCTYCAETCNKCVTYNRQDPEYPQNVTNLPLNFNYQKNDDNLGNDSCSSSACGTKNCNAGTTTFSANQIPVSPGSCTMDPNNQIPAQLNCTFKDGACQTYCSKQVSYSCCVSGSWDTVCS